MDARKGSQGSELHFEIGGAGCGAGGGGGVVQDLGQQRGARCEYVQP